VSLSIPTLEEKVHEILELDDKMADPYSAAVVGIKASISYGLEHDGAMSTHEMLILKTIQDTLYILDPHANPEYKPPCT